jgi:type II secretory pathway component PulC
MESLEQESKPYDFYAKKINERDVFVKSEELKVVQQAGAADVQLPPNFKVVGIVFSNPAQVIIEDQVAHQTYFIAENAPSNGISIKRVLSNKIILSYQNQDIEINVKGNQIDASKP